jgi:hypothetical protein
MLRQDVPLLTLWRHGGQDVPYLALDVETLKVVNRSPLFRSWDPGWQMPCIDASGEGVDGLWRLNQTDPENSNVELMRPDDLDETQRRNVERLARILRLLGLKFESLYADLTCGRQHLVKEQQDLSELFQVGLWIMFESIDRMEGLGFPPSDNPEVLSDIKIRLSALVKSVPEQHVKASFFNRLLRHGFRTLRDPEKK